MITYELAKQLKDAGFPQGISSFNFIADDGLPLVSHGYSWSGECAYIPTLSELIEACGDRFDQLDKDLGGFHCRPCIGVCERYNTPEEAVAKLYIALNKK